MTDFLKTLPQYLVPHHALSRFVGAFANCRQPHFKNGLIDWFIRHYGVDMSCAQQPDPHQYPDFNHFFTRKLKAEARPIVSAPQQLACPVDGSVSQVGAIQAGRIFQAKNFDFSLQELLGGVPERAAPFLQGQFATLYLAPKDYHRIHMPISGKLREMIYIPGRLFSVNQRTAATVPNLFARNERVVAIFDTAMGPMALVLVGAMIVASISTVWHGEIAPSRESKLQTFRYPNAGSGKIYLERGDEMGMFKLGSTVIVAFADPKIRWAETIQTGNAIKLGQLLATITA